MAKMFYTMDEAAQKLGVSGDQLKGLVSENKLREFRDGARVMFKVDQVDKLVTDRKGGTAGGTKAGSAIGLADSGIGLSPAGDSHASDVISLADTGLAPGSPAKDDTVVTGAGQKVFKPGEVKNSADTGAQTQIQSAIDDQLSLEGVGSGSGLLDLTRESDDTSLGAELLDEIYPGAGDSKAESGIGSASGIFVESSGGSSAGAGDASGPSGLEHVAAAPSAAPVMVVADEGSDPSAGAFGGMAMAAVVILIVTGLITLGFYMGVTPEWVQKIADTTTNVLIFAVALFVLSAIFAGFGFFLGRSR